MSTYPVFYVQPTPFKLKNTVPQRVDNNQLGTTVSQTFFKYPNLVPINTSTGTISNFNFTNASGTNINCTKMNIVSDYSSTVDAEQLTVQGSTNTNNQLYFGYQTSSNYGSIQSRTQGVSLRPILLNPLGGNVGINISNPSLIGSNALYVNGNIFASGTITPSDIRIKTNITDASTLKALEQINNIQLKKYDYIDTRLQDYDTDVYGVIAQQVKEVLPESVNIMTMVIPSIMKYTKFIDIDMSINPPVYTLYLNEQHNLKDNDKVRIMNKWDDSLQTYIFSEDVNCVVVSDKIIKVQLQNTEFINYNNLFVYGHEVNDFHAIDKTQLFIPLIGCVQELTKMIKNTESTKIIDNYIETQNKNNTQYIQQLKNENEKLLNDTNSKINKMKNEFENRLQSYNSNYSSQLSKQDNKINDLKNTIDVLKKHIQSLEIDKRR